MGKKSFEQLTKNIPFPITYYTLTEKEMEVNGYILNQPGKSNVNMLLSLCFPFVLSTLWLVLNITIFKEKKYLAWY